MGCFGNISKIATSTEEKMMLLDVLMMKIELNLKASEERTAIAKEYFEQWKKIRDELESEQRQCVEILPRTGFCKSLGDLMRDRDAAARVRPVIIPPYPRD